MPFKAEKWTKDFIYLTYQLEDSNDIAKIVNLSVNTVHNVAQIYNIHKVSKYIKPTMIFGCLKILGQDTTRKNNRNCYKCQCNCGNIIKKTSQELFYEMNTQCVCTIKNKDIQNIINDYKNYTTLKELGKKYNLSPKKIHKILTVNKIKIRDGASKKEYNIPGRLWRQCIYGAQQRNLDFSITKEYISSLLISQNYKCALSGVKIKFPIRGEKRSAITASLDRIDSSKGYIVGNVQWVHKRVNIMKMNMTDDIFIDWCEKIVNHKRGI